jgi:hypothetical protein
MTCTALTARSRRCSTSGNQGMTEMPRRTGESAVSATGDILDGQPGGNLLGCLLPMRRRGRGYGKSIWLTQLTMCGRKTSKDETTNMETMQGIADELVHIEEFPRGDNPSTGVYIITFGTGRGAYKLMYDRREVARGIEAALKRLVYEAIGRGQALCVRKDA